MLVTTTNGEPLTLPERTDFVLKARINIRIAQITPVPNKLAKHAALHTAERSGVTLGHSDTRVQIRTRLLEFWHSGNTRFSERALMNPTAAHVLSKYRILPRTNGSQD